MPSTRRVKMRENWVRRVRDSPFVETEPQDLRVVRRQPVMEQNAETNGCDDGPISLAVTNHTDVSQANKGEKQTLKSVPSSDNRTTKRNATRGSKSSRARRSSPAVSSHPIPTSPNAERRAKRNVPSSPVPAAATTPSTTSERRSVKNSHSSPASHVQSNKKSSHPPNLSPQSAASAPTAAAVIASQASHEPTNPNTLMPSNSRLSKHSQNLQSQSSPPSLTPQKRQARTALSPPESDLSPRASKRIRLQHQPFQSPPPPSIIPAVLRSQTPKTPEDKIVVFQKGEFLAVRNENGSFFVCRTAQNVYKSSKRFKIQWMSDKEPDLYIPDFYDQTDFECVLTNLRLRRVDKNKYQLPKDERQRTLNILQRALNVENGVDVSHPQVTTDGVDVSIVGKEDEEVLRMKQESLKAEQRNNSANLRNKTRLRKVPPPKKVSKVTRATVAAQRKPKPLAARVKLRSRETVKVKLRKEGDQIIVSNKTKKTVPNLRKIVERLHPNPKVTLYEKDPTFQMNVQIPFVSSSAHSKLLIRSILLKDIEMLQSLIKDTQKICSLNIPRSVDVSLTPLMYSVIEEDHRAIRELLTSNKRKYANPPETLLEMQGTGSYNMVMLGHAVRPITVSRGGREGNNAFLKDSSYYDTYPSVEQDVFREALRAGVSIDTVNLLYSADESKCLSWNKEEVLKHIVVAVRHGHYKLAGHLVSEAIEKDGFGFNNLHEFVLKKTRMTGSPPLRSNSVIKKATGNGRITPLHCAAINPNPQILAALLGVYRPLNLPDEQGWMPIHYAAVCSSTGPLELLLSRGASPEDVESEGNTALHAAVIAGRAHNVDLILRHLILSDTGKKEANATTVGDGKFGAGGIDRGNKKSFTPLHLACLHGHADVIRVLLRYRPAVDKMTSAAQDKLTSLMLAAQRGYINIVQLLVEHTAQVEMKDKKQRTALAHAVINGHAHVTSYLLRLGANPNSTDSSGNTLVHYAAAYGWYFCLKLLIEAGASLNLTNDWKITPLSVAFMKGHMGLVDYLVEQPGIDINVDVDSGNGMTLVMQALKSKISPSMLGRIHFLVVKQKSDCTKVDFMGNNALHHLVLTEVEEMNREIKMEEIKEQRIRPIESDHSVSGEESTDFEIKEKRKDQHLFKEEEQQEHDALLVEITKLLLDHSCDPMVKNKHGESPFTLAVKQGCIILVKMFLDAGCQLSLDVSSSGDNILHYLVTHACHRKVEPMLQAILNAKCVDPDTTPHDLLCKMAKMYNKKGHTPLLQALSAVGTYTNEESKNRLLNFAKVLMDELQADVSAPCKNEEEKETNHALHLAAVCSGGEVIEALLSHKPPLNCVNEAGQTPLVLAILKENVQAVEALVKAGANVNMKSKSSLHLSPLLLASKNPKLGKIIQLLVHNKADVNEVDPKNKNTALHYVASLRAADVLETSKSLLTAGSNVNAINDHQRTPLHLAVNASTSDSDASYAVEECLLGFGAKLDAFDCRGRMPLHYAFIKIGRHTDISQIDPIELVALLTGAMGNLPVDVPDHFGQTLLHLSAYRGATISTIHIAQRMKNLDVRDKQGNSPLGLAVKSGHESCALMLLQRGANCIADLITDKRNLNPNTDVWRWKHVEDKPLGIERHTILQETLIKDWQGLLYLMLDQLEAMGKGINIAVEAALKTAKYNVALKLIGRVKHGWTLYSEKQGMLHVLAREAPSKHLPNLQVKVAQFLIEKGVPTMARDEHGCSVLTYAAINWNNTLCSFFSGKIGMPTSAKTDPDKSLRTPLTALFWKLGEDDLPEEMRNFFSALIAAGATPNVLTRYPICSSSFPGVRCSLVDDLYIEDPAAPKFSPLMMAIYKRNYAVVKLVLSKSADVNFPDDQLLTPLMHAVRLNDIKMVKLLLNFTYDPIKDRAPYSDTDHGSFQKTSDADLSAQDVNGFTVVHHLVAPLPDYCYDNTVLLYFLAEKGAPLDKPNKAGETPLQMALKLKREPVISALQELLNIPEDKRDKTEPYAMRVLNDGIQWDQPSWDFKADSKAMLDKINSEQMDVDKDSTDFKPDPLSGASGEIVNDTEKNIPYDVLMTVVDLNYGAYGIYNFYKMQLIAATGKDMYMLFTRWGRVGDTGQYQMTPFGNLQDGVKEFCRIFRAKTANNWDDVQNFTPQPKKYRLVSLDNRKCTLPKKISINLKTDLTTKLSKPLQMLMENLMNVHTFEDALSNLGIEAAFDVLPFGSLSEETLNSALDLLKEIGNVINEKDNLQPGVKSQEKFGELMHKIVKLSEEFYQLVPVYGFQYEKLRPLFSSSELHEKLVFIHNLQHIGIAGEMLLAANLRTAEFNPKDYVYRSLDCKLQLLDRETQEAQMILEYIHNTANYSKPEVQAIYTVNRPNEQEALNDTKLSHRYLLWHGTRTANLLSILSRGLQVAPLGAQMSGSLFGKGIYLADMFAKSQKYCVSHGAQGAKYMLLCEAALGDTKEIDYSLVLNPDDKYDSVKALGHTQPNPAECISWQGITVPLGSPVEILEEGSPSQHRFLRFNEYVVYKSSQVCIRYVVQFVD